MIVRFRKMHGAGNDFILIDDRDESFPCGRERIARLADRKRGIGADGLILLRSSRRADFRMVFFNPDGREAEMCGNGARCAVRLAHELGLGGARISLETGAGELSAEVIGEDVRLAMTAPVDWRLGRELAVNGRSLRYGFVNTGVPHAVLDAAQFGPDEDALARYGADVRRHPDFAPKGTNVNFAAATGPDSLFVRTYERGVEAETQACGTGVVASALVMARAGLVRAPVRVRSAGGDVLTVDFAVSAEGVRDVTLLGPAVHVFSGEVSV